MKAGWWDTTLVLRDLAEAIPIISGDGLALLTKNIFQTTYPFSLDHLVYVYWYLGYLSGRPFIKTPPPTPPSLLFGTETKTCSTKTCFTQKNSNLILGWCRAQCGIIGSLLQFCFLVEYLDKTIVSWNLSGSSLLCKYKGWCLQDKYVDEIVTGIYHYDVYYCSAANRNIIKWAFLQCFFVKFLPAVFLFHRHQKAIRHY